MMDSLKIGNGLPMVGPGTDIGISSPPMVGYLGKNYDSATVTPDGYCPVCKEKGKLKALRTYQISFQESIFLCEDLQCIYPLGSKSVASLISPGLEECHTPNKPQKRKIPETSCKDLPLLVNSKKTRLHAVTDAEQILNNKHSGEVCGETSSNLPSTSHQSPGRTVGSLEQNETLEAAEVDVATEEDAASVDVSESGAVLPQNERPELEVPPESRCLSFCESLCVQWENTQALCWLDCILSALVHLERLKNAVDELCSREECVFWRLFEKYNQANELLYTHHLHDVTGENCEKLTSEIFAEIETCLNEVRDEIFTKLQPQLRCTLGEMESPVFALPLLLKIEPHIEKLFTYSFSWSFHCSQCGHQYHTRCLKNLVTFTNVIPEWHPLNAAHFGPCNICNNKSQIRKMILEIMSPVFMLHFVEGLPQNDLQHYEFEFEGSLYQITSVIQYQASNHFITWILDVDGSWLVCDDLKGPCANRYEKFDVPPSEIHIVIWERKMFQVIDNEAARLLLKKHALGEEKSASPAKRSVGETAGSEASVSHPAHLPVDPQTPPQSRAQPHADHVPSDTKGLVDSILPLTVEGTIKETASVFQSTSKDSLSEDSPGTESISLVKTHTLQSQEPLMTLLSNPCKEKLVHAQFVDVNYPSKVVSSNMQLVQSHVEDTTVPKSVTSVHIPVQESVETETDTQLKFLPLKTEKLKPEQHSVSQVSNLKNKETTKYSKTVAARSSQNQPLKENQKKPFVGSWVKGLLSRGAAFMPPCVSAQNRNTITSLQPSVKGANNFDGFKTKSTSRKTSWVSKKARKCVAEASAVGSSTGSGSRAALPSACGNGALEPPRKQESTSHVAHLNHNPHSNENGISLASHGAVAEDQVHKLRLKLLKKLKAKKKKLAALMASPQNTTVPSENVEAVSHCGSPDDCESIEDLLSELQYQIDLADNKAMCPPVPSVTSCSSQSHEDILAELLSPTPMSTEFQENVESDFRYLEMGNDTSPTSVSSELNGISQNPDLKQDHTYCSPTKKNQCEIQPDSLTNSTCVKTLNLEESPMKTDIFDEFFSPSALNSLTNDTLDLPHFDEYLFETC